MLKTVIFKNALKLPLRRWSKFLEFTVTDEMKGTLFCVSEPKTAILGGPDIHLKEGSTMNLTCRITDSPEPPSYIFWRHDDSVRHAKDTHTF